MVFRLIEPISLLLVYFQIWTSYDPLGEFDCVADGFWPETVDLLCSNLDEMFAPGDPDRFYAVRFVF